jgi:hypothetical protein
VCIKTKAKKSVIITITIAIILFSFNAIKSISVLSVELKNMYLSHVKADYVHFAGQKQQTNGLIESIIFF